MPAEPEPHHFRGRKIIRLKKVICWPAVSSEHVCHLKPELEVFCLPETSVGIHQDLNDFLVLEIEQSKHGTAENVLDVS